MPTEEAYQFLRSVLPIEPQHEDDLRELAGLSLFHEYRHGDYVFFEEETTDTGYYLVSGRIALRKTSPNGKQLIVALLPPGEPFGLLAAADKRPLSLSAQAQIDCRVLALPGGAFARLLHSDNTVAKAMLDMMGRRLRSLQEVSRALAHDKVEVRAAATLLSLRPRFMGQNPNELPLSRQELADLLGVSLETATRTMKALEHDGVVDLSHFGRVLLLEPERLEQIIHDHG